MKNYKQGIKVFFLAAFSVAFFLAGAEFFLRSTQLPDGTGGYKFDRWVTEMLNKNAFLYDSVLLFKMNPNSSWEYINSQGFRDKREYSSNKQEGVLRILCLGDSITFGVGAGLKDTYPFILEEALNNAHSQAGVRFEVWNFGIPGYTSYQGLQLLRTRVLAYAPDLVIISYLWNDMWEHEWVLEDKDQYLPPAYIVKTVYLLKKLKFFLLTERYVYNIRSKMLGRMHRGGRVFVRVSLDDYASNYRQMLQILRENKIASLILLPPADARQGYMPMYEQRSGVLREVAAAFGVPIADPNDIVQIRPDECFLSDHFHLTPYGNATVVKAILAALDAGGGWDCFRRYGTGLRAFGNAGT